MLVESAIDQPTPVPIPISDDLKSVSQNVSMAAINSVKEVRQ